MVKFKPNHNGRKFVIDGTYVSEGRLKEMVGSAKKSLELKEKYEGSVLEGINNVNERTIKIILDEEYDPSDSYPVLVSFQLLNKNSLDPVRIDEVIGWEYEYEGEKHNAMGKVVILESDVPTLFDVSASFNSFEVKRFDLYDKYSEELQEVL